ncbi:M48 family metallopeptidase [Amycolatopsis sp. NBC_00348]|uniref:M48 family metallopeptidase n=1 Tax=unclassified Amycolatopsis TaxID=2618356 RepID=UPI002E1679EE|nr:MULTISPECIES: M48 family metallopeptidase [unclassified Amycolatopsis]WSJ77469.1 M48 family metallopeptidase [Amycolatopsis sp. NBC_01307]
MTEDIEISRHNAVRFPGISPRAYEHPVDRGALATLRAVPGFAQVVKAVSGFYNERGERLMALASSIRVGPKQYPELEKLRHECAETLDLPAVPNVFVYQDPRVQASAVGMDEPFIRLSTGLVELMSPDALRFVLGHEMGHVLSGHTVYRTIMVRLISLQLSMSWTPVSALGIRAIIAALREWYRKAELSCDRAGLLCSQDPTAALRAQIQVAGGIDPARIDIPSFLQQATEYESVDDIRDSFLKLRYVETESHPFAVVRAAQLQKWAASAEYRAILAGDYPRRDDDSPTADWKDDLKSAAKAYKDSWSASADPLTKVFSDVGETVSGAAGKVWNKFGNGSPSES